jgi:hypothetical protein
MHTLPRVHATLDDGTLHTNPAGQGTATDTPAGHHAPLEHAVANPATQNEPAGHVVWAVDLAGHTNPLSQATCTDVFLHTYPAAHDASTVVATGQKLPSAQATRVAGVAHTYPAPHHCSPELPAGQYAPDWHVVGAVTPTAHWLPAGHWICAVWPSAQ